MSSLPLILLLATVPLHPSYHPPTILQSPPINYSPPFRSILMKILLIPTPCYIITPKFLLLPTMPPFQLIPNNFYVLITARSSETSSTQPSWPPPSSHFLDFHLQTVMTNLTASSPNSGKSSPSHSPPTNVNFSFDKTILLPLASSVTSTVFGSLYHHLLLHLPYNSTYHYTASTQKLTRKGGE